MPDAIFLAIFSMCIFHERFSSICTPRDLTELTCLISFYALSLLFGPCRLSELTLARASFNIQGNRSTRGLLAKPLKFPKSLIRSAGSHFWLPPNLQWELSVWMNINRVTLQHNKELIMFVFYLMVLKRCVIFKSVLYARHFEYSCKRCSWTTENNRHSD